MSLLCCGHVEKIGSNYCEYCWEAEKIFREMSYLVSELSRKFPIQADRTRISLKQGSIVDRWDSIMSKGTFTPNLDNDYMEKL